MGKPGLFVACFRVARQLRMDSMFLNGGEKKNISRKVKIIGNPTSGFFGEAFLKHGLAQALTLCLRLLWAAVAELTAVTETRWPRRLRY